MAIVTSTTYQEATGQTFSGDDLTALASTCVAVDAAVRRMIHPFVPEPTTYTSKVMDAPIGNVLELPAIPVRSITSLYLRYGADGDSSAFTSDDLLTAYSDYYLPLDPILGYSRTGHVLRRGASSWGYEYRRPVGRLSGAIDPNRGSIMATFLAGPLSLPDDLAHAAVLAVSKLFRMRKSGTMVASASLNGASYSFPASSLNGVFADPTIAELLSSYVDPVRVGSL